MISFDPHHVAGERSVEWVADYGSLVTTGYDIATADGMNEAGLVVNLLWEVEASYPKDDGETPRISLSVFPQYLLHRGAPPRSATVHVSMSDASGDSAIIEFVDGDMVIWHDRSYQVMTNEPTFDRQLVVASVFSVIRQTSVPWGISVADQPNLSTTRWRVVADHHDKRYCVESVISPSVFWVELDALDLSDGAAVIKLDLGVDMERVLSGEVSELFEPAAPFVFQPAD